MKNKKIALKIANEMPKPKKYIDEKYRIK